MLCGENGAGKSSLMKVLCGAYVADEGELFNHGEKIEIKSTLDARKFGIAVIFQEFSLVRISASPRTFISAVNSREKFQAPSTARRSGAKPSACWR